MNVSSRRKAPLALGVDPSKVTERLASPRVQLQQETVDRLASVCELETDPSTLVAAARDWWPITIEWATRGEVPALPYVVARPSETKEVSELLRVCNEACVPVTPMAGRSGVCGGSIPAFGGVALDMSSMQGVTDFDDVSFVAGVLPGTFGPDLEESLQARGATLGHWPQSMDISTVGGWVACRGAGQYSTRYGKIEDMVRSLEVVLTDGSVIRTGADAPRAASGPDLTQLFVGAEGTLGVITSSTFAARAKPEHEIRLAFGFASFADGLDACRRIVQRGATPAVLRLYDETESKRNFSLDDVCALIVLDEADPAMTQVTGRVVEDESLKPGPSDGRASPLDVELVERWLQHRNDVSALGPLYEAGIVVDTIEIAGKWSDLDAIYREACDGLERVPGTLAASAHQSHSYTDGACLYFTFAGRMPDAELGSGSDREEGEAYDAWAQSYYENAWDCVMDVVISHSAAISHHHGIGINRARYMGRSSAGASTVLESVKNALDPRGILNPGKLGLPSPFGEIHWP